MDQELVLSIVLTSYGNACLAGQLSPATLEANTAFAGLASIEFVDDLGELVSSSPAEWLRLLGSAQARRLWLVMRDGVSGVQVDYDEVIEVWGGYCESESQVVYQFAPLTESLATPALPLEHRIDALRSALRGIRFFAEFTQHTDWAEWFAEALAILDTVDGNAPESGLLAPIGYAEEARRVFEAAQAAWVFGGAGSWSDLQFDDAVLQQQYDALTASLYDAVAGSILDVTNAFDHRA